jgi:hypothetical protein
MTTSRRPPAGKRPPLRPEGLNKEAETLRRFARRARDPGTRQDFEDMAERRARVAQAVEALVSDPPADEVAPTETAKPDKPAKKP